MFFNNLITSQHEGRLGQQVYLYLYRSRQLRTPGTATQYGRFEKLNKKDKHMGEVDKCLNEKGKQNSSGGHDIRIK